LDEREVIERRKQGNVRDILQKAVHRLFDMGVEMDRIDDLYIAT